MVEGWSEEILLPSVAKKMKKDKLIAKNLTESGVSIVNVGNREFLRYSKIFLRKENPKITIPVAIITDVDIRHYSRTAKTDEEGIQIKENGKNAYCYNKEDPEFIKEETIKELEEKKKEFTELPVKAFITDKWTLEYSLLQSEILHDCVKSVLKDMYPQIDLKDIEKELAKKLLGKSLNKPDFANKISEKIDPDSDKYDDTITLRDGDDCLKSLMDAIKYVCN